MNSETVMWEGGRSMPKRLCLAALAAAALLFFSISALQRTHIEALSRQMDTLTDKLDRTQGELNGLALALDKALDRIKALETTEAPLVSSYLLSIQGLDAPSRTLTLRLDAELDIRDLGTSAQLSLRQGSDTQFFLLTQDPQQPRWYTGTAQLSLAELEKEVSFQLTAQAEGSQRSETLCTFPSHMDLLDVKLKKALGRAEYTGGQLRFTGWEVAFLNALPGSEAIRVYQDGVLTQELPLTGTPMDFTVDCASGSTVELRYAARDSWGLSYEFPGRWWETGGEKAVAHYPTTSRARLLWPE